MLIMMGLLPNRRIYILPSIFSQVQSPLFFKDQLSVHLLLVTGIAIIDFFPQCDQIFDF